METIDITVDTEGGIVNRSVDPKVKIKGLQCQLGIDAKFLYACNHEGKILNRGHPLNVEQSLHHYPDVATLVTIQDKDTVIHNGGGSRQFPTFTKECKDHLNEYNEAAKKRILNTWIPSFLQSIAKKHGGMRFFHIEQGNTYPILKDITNESLVKSTKQKFRGIRQMTQKLENIEHTPWFKVEEEDQKVEPNKTIDGKDWQHVVLILSDQKQEEEEGMDIDEETHVVPTSTSATFTSWVDHHHYSNHDQMDNNSSWLAEHQTLSTNHNLQVFRSPSPRSNGQVMTHVHGEGSNDYPAGGYEPDNNTSVTQSCQAFRLDEMDMDTMPNGRNQGDIQRDGSIMDVFDDSSENLLCELLGDEMGDDLQHLTFN